MTTMNDLIRAASGRPVAGAVTDVTPERSSEQHVGSIGIGRGGSAGPRPRVARSNAEINARIRRGARIVRNVSLRDGLSLDVDDPWG